MQNSSEACPASGAGSSGRKYDFDFSEEEWQSGSRSLSPIRTSATPPASLIWNVEPKFHTVVHVPLAGTSPRKQPAGRPAASLSLRSRLFLAAGLTMALLLLIGLGFHFFGCGASSFPATVGGQHGPSVTAGVGLSSRLHNTVTLGNSDAPAGGFSEAARRAVESGDREWDKADSVRTPLRS